jgi:predicted permease
MGQILDDVRYALRGLRKSPLFTAVAVLSMAFGIAANAAVFTLVDQVILRTLPVERPHELVQLTARGTETYSGGIGDGTELSYAMYKDLRDRNQAFASLACRMPFALAVGDGDTTEQVAAELVSGSFFPMLGVRPAVGRLLEARDDPDGGGVAVAAISFAYWQSRFGGDRAVVGRTVTINNQPFEIVGVVDGRFAGLDLGAPAQVYVPVTMQPKLGPAWLALDGRRFRWVQVYGRRAPGMSVERASASLEPLYSALLAEEARDAAFDNASADTRKRFLAGRLALDDASRGHSGLRSTVTEPLLILMAIAGGVLLIVCANVANLLVARGASRQREIALRLAIGAGQGRIVRLLLVESALLAAMGALAGVVLASWGAGALLGFFVTPDSPLGLSASPDVRILAFTAALAAGTAIVAGLIPAWRSSRVPLAPALKSAGGGVVGEQPRLRKTLVVVQVALSFVLVVGAGLFLRSLQNLLQVDPGLRTERILTFTFDLAASGYDRARAQVLLRDLDRRLARVPGVEGAAHSFISVLSGSGWGMDFTVEGYRAAPGEAANAMCNAVSPGYVDVMGIPLVAGRGLTARDDRVLPAPEGWPYRVALVNETFVRRYFKGANPVGRHIGFGADPGTPMPIEIVGVVRDSNYISIREDARPQVFFSFLQAGDVDEVNVYLRTAGDPAAVMPAVRREMADMDARIALFGVTSLEDKAARSIVNERLMATLSATLAAMATLLSIVGLYGVMAYMVTRRTREIGIRMALGAVSRQIAAGVLREAAVLAAAGLAIGGVAAWMLGRFVQSQLYGTTPTDPIAMAAGALVLAAVAGAASLVPARRAARIAPVTALRDE